MKALQQPRRQQRHHITSTILISLVLVLCSVALLPCVSASKRKCNAAVSAKSVTKEHHQQQQLRHQLPKDQTANHLLQFLSIEKKSVRKTIKNNRKHGVHDNKEGTCGQNHFDRVKSLCRWRGGAQEWRGGASPPAKHYREVHVDDEQKENNTEKEHYEKNENRDGENDKKNCKKEEEEEDAHNKEAAKKKIFLQDPPALDEEPLPPSSLSPLLVDKIGPYGQPTGDKLSVRDLPIAVIPSHRVSLANGSSPPGKYDHIIIKALLFLFFSSLGCVMPFLPVYYHSLGVTDKHIGHLGAITPAVTFLVSPLWAAFVDNSGKLKEILVFTFITSVCLRVAMVANHSMAWIVLMVTATSIVNAPVRPLLDSSVLNLLQDKKQYGKQRLWGQIGFGVGSCMAGPLLGKTSLGYKAAFVAHAVLSVPTLLLLLKFKPKKMKKEPPRFKEGLSLLSKDQGAIVFFGLVFAIGLSSGVIENFAYKRLRELGATSALFGNFRLISAFAGIPMFYFSGSLPKVMSVMGVLTLSIVSYILRFLIYASVKNPRSAMPAEVLRGTTFAAFWAASTYHAHRIAPAGLSTTMLGLLNAVYGGIGQSLGSLIGGALSSKMGTAGAFYTYAAADAVLLVFALLYWGLGPKASAQQIEAASEAKRAP